MNEDTGITRIEKESAQEPGQHVVTVEGVVKGEKRAFHMDPETFHRLERQGDKHLREQLRETLERMHER